MLIRNRLSTFETTPLQIYSSAMIFFPDEIQLRKLFQSSVPPWVCGCPTIDAGLKFTSTITIPPIACYRPTFFDISPDHTSLVLALGDGYLRFYDLNYGTLTARKRVSLGILQGITFSQNGKMLAAISRDGESGVVGENYIFCWELPDTRLCCSHTFPGSLKPLTVAFSANDHLLAVVVGDEKLYVQDQTKDVSYILLGETKIPVRAALFSANGRRIALTAERTFVYNVSDEPLLSCVYVVDFGVNNSMTFSPDGDRLALINYSDIHILNISKGTD